MEAAGFASTRWSLVLAAKGDSAPESATALASLCRMYWPLLYAYARRRGYSVEDSQDLTQAFFSRFLEKQYLSHVERERGKFRAFLISTFRNFLANEWDRQQAQKRGGSVEFLSLDEFTRVERDYSGDVTAAHLTPDKLYERKWALTVLGTVVARLQDEFGQAGKSAVFTHLKPYLTGDGGAGYAATSQALGMSEVAVRVSVHRLRGRFRDLLRAEIAETIEKPEDSGVIDEELRYLFGVL